MDKETYTNITGYADFFYKGNKYNKKFNDVINGHFPVLKEDRIKYVKRETYKKPQKLFKKNTISKTETPYDYFIRKSTEIHGGFYKYDKITKDNYKGINSDVEVYCPNCKKYFITNAYIHSTGHKCPVCAKEESASKIRFTIDEVISKANKVHNNKYDYSLITTYKNCETKYPIICPLHGTFIQSMNNHLRGVGCPICNESRLENEIRHLLKENSINNECSKHFDWLKYKGTMHLDFFLPDINVAIECQGIQHFSPVEFFGGKKAFDEEINRDTAKNELCRQNGIKILYFCNKETFQEMPIYKKDNTFFEKDEILKIIQML